MGDHKCPLPPSGFGTDPQQPDWTCGECGRVWRDWNGGGSGAVRWWAEVRGPSASPKPVVTEQMVERAARAIYARTPLRDAVPYTRWDELLPWVRDRLRRDARVALEAALSPEEGE